MKEVQKMRTQKRAGRKRMATGVLAAFMALAMVFGAAAAEKKAHYAFPFKEQKVEVGMNADAAKKILGQEKEVKALSNCAEEGGKDKAYIYDGIEMVTTKEGKKEVVKEITLKAATAGTEEGVKVGDLPGAVKKAYPDAKAESGLYTAVLGDTQIVVDCGFKDDKVVSITYMAAEKK